MPGPESCMAMERMSVGSCRLLTGDLTSAARASSRLASSGSRVQPRALRIRTFSSEDTVGILDQRWRQIVSELPSRTAAQYSAPRNSIGTLHKHEPSSGKRRAWVDDGTSKEVEKNNLRILRALYFFKGAILTFRSNLSSSNRAERQRSDARGIKPNLTYHNLAPCRLPRLVKVTCASLR